MGKKGIKTARELSKSKTIREAVGKNSERVLAKSADVAGDFVSKKISDFGSRYREPEEEDDEEIPNNSRRETSAREVLAEEMEERPKRYIPPGLRRINRLTNL